VGSAETDARLFTDIHIESNYSVGVTPGAESNTEKFPSAVTMRLS